MKPINSLIGSVLLASMLTAAPALAGDKHAASAKSNTKEVQTAQALRDLCAK
jgi:hypothetical protein